MKAKPFFTIIIPTYNRAGFLKIAVESVLNQTFSDYEIIIVDDGSTDKTKEIIKPYLKKTINYIYQDNEGPAAARNFGLKQANGEFICFLDSDDRFRENKLKITNEYIKKLPQYKVFHTEEIWYRKGEYLAQKIYHQKPTGFVFKNSVKICSIGMSTSVIKKDIFEEIGTFDESLLACEDYDFWLRVTAKHQVYLIPQYLTIKEGGRPDQQSFKYPAMDTFRIYALKKILEDNSLSKDNLKIAADELKRKCEIFIKGALKRNKIEEAEKYTLLAEKYKNL